MSERFDAVVIGAGQAGPSLAVRLAQSGRKTALIERGVVGGTCVNNGCIPTKTLIASARAAYIARRCGDYGVTIQAPIGVDMAQVKRRKDGVVQASVESLTRWLGATPGLDTVHGQARFDSPRTVRVGERVLAAEQFFINVGGRALVPAMHGLADVPYFTNATMMHVDFLPEHLLIIGGSYIGLEFAQMYRRFGSRVSVIEMGSRLIGREDEDVSAAIQAILEAEGINFRLDAECIEVARHAEGVVARLRCDEPPSEIAGSHLLLAVGRAPNTADLGLEQAGVETDARGYITVDEQLRTNVPGIWALGDVNGRGAFTHTSYNDYEIVAANLLDGDARRVTDRIATYGLFIDPPLGRAGMTLREVRASGREALVGTLPMTRVGRARERGETQGFMRVLVDAQSQRILGASILGIEGDEAVHVLLDAMVAGVPYTVIRRAVHIHPTVAELIPTLLGNLQRLA